MLPVRFLRGDCNGSGGVVGSPSDAVFVLNFNFLAGATPPCLAACDANNDGAVIGSPADGVYILNFNFLAGPPPAAPYPNCGYSSSAGDATLGCETVSPECDVPPWQFGSTGD